MKREMDRFASVKPVAPQDKQTDPEVRERLASFGYVMAQFILQDSQCILKMEFNLGKN